MIQQESEIWIDKPKASIVWIFRDPGTTQKKGLESFLCSEMCGGTLWEITQPGYSPLLNQVIDQFPIGHCVSIGQKKVYPEESARAWNTRWIHTSNS